MIKTKRILLIEFCNFENYPIGGYLSFAKNLLISFKQELALVGISTSKEDPIGTWFKKNINGKEFDYFALTRYNNTNKTKHIIPDRLVIFILLKFYRKKISAININNVFIQRAEILIATKKFHFTNICFRFAGLENPLAVSKYWYTKYLAISFDKIFFSSFKKVKLILATGDANAINNMLLRSKGKINMKNMKKFPTRINTEIFKPLNKNEKKFLLNIPEKEILITTVGRLSLLKGWVFMIDSFIEFSKSYPESLLYFIGEGEDFDKINDYIITRNLTNKVKLAGKQAPEIIADYLNASDIFIMGSYKEGWSTTLLEASACGVPVCATNFSSAKEIVKQGLNGYVIDNHDVLDFARIMEKALNISRTKLPLKEEIQKYAVSELKNDILTQWEIN